MMNEMTFSYQTRLSLDERQKTILHECASLFNTVEHALYREVAKGKTSASCKNTFLKDYGITARQFNACRVSLEGKISACKEAQKLAKTTLKHQIDVANKKIQQLEKQTSKRFILHQKKRREKHLSRKLSALEVDQREGRVRLCFGGKKLFRAQFHLEKSGFSSMQQWKEAWKAKRSSEFFIMGSKDETAGNQTCTARLGESGTFTLRLRLPKVLEAQYGKYLELENVAFAYGHEAILASLNNPEGQALSYRFKVDHKGWRIFVSTNLKKPATITQEGIGVIGIDLNADHIAYVETDRFGNLVEKKVLPWISYGKSQKQLKAATGDLCKEIVERAKETKKPVVIEELNFQNKKMSLKELGTDKLKRLLSSFSYNLFSSFLLARAYREGVAVHRVNPAYTSVIGRVNYTKRLGLSIHLAAALCIARRWQKLSEAPSSSEGMISDGKGGHFAFVLPVRNRAKHVWHFWGQVKKKLTAVHAAHFRATRCRSKSPRKSTFETGNSQSAGVRSPFANR